MKNARRVSCTLTDYNYTGFEALTEEQKAYLSKHETIVEYKKGEALCKQGSFANHVLIMEKGLAKVIIEDEYKSLILKLVPEKNILGLTSLSSNRPVFHYSAIAYNDVTVRQIELHAFKELIRKNPDFAFAIFDVFTANSVQIYGRFFCLTRKQSFGKLADILLCLSDRVFKDSVFTLELTRKDIAELADMSTESVIRILKKFKDDGLIEIKGHTFKILDKEKLVELSALG